MLLTATFCLLAGGAVMVYSASSARTLLEGHGDGTGYLVKYLMYGAVGLVVMHLLARRGLERVRRCDAAAAGRAFVLLVLVLLPGLRRRGQRRAALARRRPAQFQPAELMKLALVLHARRVCRPSPAARACAASPARCFPAAARCC